jgi:uncharacterized protein with NRDE domain
VCTLVVAFREVPGAPLVVAANRDERLDRPAEPPHLWPQGFLAPRDLLAGGSWLGLNRHGLFVGVTNRFGVAKDEKRASRGELVTTALGAGSARELHDRLRALPPDRYNAFHLLYGDRRDAFVTWCDGSHVFQEILAPGVHVITERSLGASDEGRTERILAEWKKIAGNVDEAALEGIMRIHGERSPLEGTCVHLAALGYGTRSSMVLFLADDEGASRMLWAEGSPCETPYVPVPLLPLQMT